MKRVIIADDSQTALMFNRKCLEIAGFRGAEFVEVPSGEEVFKSLESVSADLLVTDLNMPGVDGVKVLVRIRADKRIKDLPIIVVTSVMNTAKEAELKALGASAILPKPVSPAAMARAVKALFR